MPVHGRDVEPALERGETDRDLLETVGQDRRDLVATLQPGCPETPHDLVRELGEFAVRHLVVVGINDRKMVGIRLRDLPESGDIGVGHVEMISVQSAIAPISLQPSAPPTYLSASGINSP